MVNIYQLLQQYYASPLPHLPLQVPQKYVDEYVKLFGDEKPYLGKKGYFPNRYPNAAYAGMISYLDEQVGEIIEKLKDYGIYENTLIVFTSDNGPHMEGGADPQFFNSSGGLRGVKRDLYEGGVRVPMIVRWPGKIQSGRTSHHISAFWDVFPTVAELAGIEAPSTDGISFVPELLGVKQNKHEFLYWEFHEQGGKQAILMDDWKAVRLNVGKDPHGPIELYNLDSDPSEEQNVAEAHPDLVEAFSRMMEEERKPSAKFNFGRVAKSTD